MQADPSSQQELPLTPPDAGESSSSPPAVFSSGALDQEQGWGRRRLMAVISARAPENHLELNAESLLEQLATVFFSAPLLPIDQALSQAIETTLNLAEAGGDDEGETRVVGLAVAALEEDHLFLAAQAPCRAALWQDREMVYLPSDTSVQREADGQTSLPEILETTLTTGDRLAFLAAPEQTRDAVFNSAETLERAASSSGSFLWLEVTEEEPPPVVESPVSSNDPLPPVPIAQMRSTATLSSGSNVRRDLVTSRGPRLLQRPPGSDALHRYGSASRSGAPSALRSRLPRGAPPLQALLLIGIALVMVVVAAYFAAQRRPERTYQESATAAQYSDAVAAAITAEDTDLVNALLPGAHTLLDRAGGDDSNSDDAVSLRLQIVAANDYLNSVVRIQNPRKIGAVPDSLESHELHLIQAAGVLYLVGGDIFTINVDDRQLVALPELISEQSAGSLISGGGDISTLAMTTDDTAYFYGDSVGGSTTVLPSWPADFGLRSTDTTVFRGRLYMIDLDSAEIVVIDPGTDETSLWIQRDSDILPESPVGMAIDGAIHVLYSSGEIYTLKEGYVVGKATLPVLPELTQPVAIAFDGANSNVYIADAGSPEGRLIAWNSETGVTTSYSLGPDTTGHLDGSVHAAFVGMTDLLVSNATLTVTWIADNAIWQADLPPPAEDEEGASGSPTPDAT